MIDGEYKKILKQYHKLSDRHILVAETDMPYSDMLKIVVLSDKIHKAGNELVGLMRKNYDQLFRTKRYRKLLSLYGNTGDKANSGRTLEDDLKELAKLEGNSLRAKENGTGNRQCSDTLQANQITLSATRSTKFRWAKAVKRK